MADAKINFNVPERFLEQAINVGNFKQQLSQHFNGKCLIGTDLLMARACPQLGIN